jgi:restriction system protein
MPLWICKGGRRGQRESRMLENSVLAIGWEDFGDLSQIKTRNELKRLYKEIRPDASEGRMRNHVGQIFSFLRKAKIGDAVVVPLKTTRKIAVGEVKSDYEFRDDLGVDIQHTRRVRWKKTDVPRTSFDQDLLYSFGAYMTFCQARAKNAQERVLDIVLGKKPVAPTKGLEVEILRDIEDEAFNQISDFISTKFKGHELATLVAAILEAQGFMTAQSPPGSDGGVDIAASRGPLGLSEPRICVQVKSSESAVGVDVYRQLKGTMSSINATHGLLVSWGGFKSTVEKEARKDAFQIRLWRPQQLIEHLLENYEKIDPEIKAKIPLRKIWALSPSE